MNSMEKPPILRGSEQEQINAIRDYLFRMASSLGDVLAADSSTQAAVQMTTRGDGTQVIRTGGGGTADIAAVRKNAEELRSLMLKSARDLRKQINQGDSALDTLIRSGDNYVMEYCDRKEEEYNSLYVARSEFGAFEESITSRIENTAKGVVESYGYSSAIDSMQESIDLIQHYYANIDGEIRRGVVEDPETGEYVTGIAISQNLKFSGECGPSDGNNPGDGYTYYYLNSGQTFGLYTSTGWQFWIDGYKRGWFNSEDGMLHVANIIVENALQIGACWQLKTATDGSEFEILYIGE